MPESEPLVGTRAELERRLLHFVNEVLPKLDRRERHLLEVSADTPLFESGLLDSLSILHLIAAIEDITGSPVPDHMVVMKHFRSVAVIAAAFAQPESHHE